jgi:hypothetical protein
MYLDCSSAINGFLLELQSPGWIVLGVNEEPVKSRAVACGD